MSRKKQHPKQPTEKREINSPHTGLLSVRLGGVEKHSTDPVLLSRADHQERFQHWYRLACCSLLAIACVVAYRGTLSCPLLFDDIPAIRDNPTIRHLNQLGSLLLPRQSLEQVSGVTGRPLINLSLAIDYAFSGLNPRGYHGTNIAIHAAAALALFGIIWRTLERIGITDLNRSKPGPVALAFAATLLWAVHPLQTESVTCVIQRTESLMGLCFLLTLYSFVRYADAARGRRLWGFLAFFFCLLGMASKEVMVVAPIVVMLFDRVYISKSLKEAWERHGRLHVALASTWLLLAFLVLYYGGRRGTAAGFGQGVSSWSYLMTQCRAIILYLRLSVWPHPLVVDYGTALVNDPREVWPQASIIVMLLAGIGFALVARPYLGFLGAWFFLILAPSSSIVPLVAQTIAEHRMYLPLAAIVVLVVTALARCLGLWAVPVCAALAAVCLGLTLQRNRVYQSALQVWSDTVANVPDNERAHNNLGFELENVPGRLDDAVAQIQEALRLRPNFAEAHLNMGNAWFKLPGRVSEAIREYKVAVRLKPNLATAHFDLANAYLYVPGRVSDAISEYEKAINLDPSNAAVHSNFAHALEDVPGRTNDAIAQYHEALRLDPDLAEAHFSLAIVLLKLPGGQDEARKHLEEGLRISPNDATARRILESIQAPIR